MDKHKRMTVRKKYHRQGKYAMSPSLVDKMSRSHIGPTWPDVGRAYQCRDTPQEWGRNDFRGERQNVKNGGTHEQKTARIERTPDSRTRFIVHAPDKSTGKRVQQVEISYNCIGVIELPDTNETDSKTA